MTPEARFEELLQTARADESILGLILYGSRAAGMFVRDDSDWDVWLIVRVGAFADYAERYDSEHGDPVEIGTDTVAGLRAHGEPGTSHAWNRYAFRQTVWDLGRQWTVPLVVIDGDPVGGYQELAALDRSGLLAERLAA